MTGFLILSLIAGSIIVAREKLVLARDLRVWMHRGRTAAPPNRAAVRPPLLDLSDIDWRWPTWTP